MATIEFPDVGSVCTAVMTLPMENMDEHFGAPVAIGYYPTCGEIWIQKDGEPINIPVCHLKDFIKQLRRAALLEKESGDGR
jgi:hypothetical protein